MTIIDKGELTMDNNIKKIFENSTGLLGTPPFNPIDTQHLIHDEVYNYKRFILLTRDFKKGKELLEDAVCHRVITQKEYNYLTGYTDGLRDGGKQNG